MTLEWWKRGDKLELRSPNNNITWAVINRAAPYYRVRLLHGPCSQLKRANSLRSAKELALEWFTERTT